MPFEIVNNIDKSFYDLLLPILPCPPHSVSFPGILSFLQMILQLQDQVAPLWGNLEVTFLVTPSGSPQGSPGQELEYKEED